MLRLFWPQACGILAPNQGNCTPALEGVVLATGLPGNPKALYFKRGIGRLSPPPLCAHPTIRILSARWIHSGRTLEHSSLEKHKGPRPVICKYWHVSTARTPHFHCGRMGFDPGWELRSCKLQHSEERKKMGWEQWVADIWKRKHPAYKRLGVKEKTSGELRTTHDGTEENAFKWLTFSDT